MWVSGPLTTYARSLLHIIRASASTNAPVPKSKPERECERIGEPL